VGRTGKKRDAYRLSVIKPKDLGIYMSTILKSILMKQDWKKRIWLMKETNG
jgi:hypothetical protein